MEVYLKILKKLMIQFNYKTIEREKQGDKSQPAQMIRKNPLVLLPEYHRLQRKTIYTKEQNSKRFLFYNNEGIKMTNLSALMEREE